MTGEVMLFGEYERVISSYSIEDWDKLIFEQFTGLHDKNGKEIYEGDIVRNDQRGWNVVVYKAPQFEATVSETQSCMYTIQWWEKVEVIGNIHENPELLTI